MPLLVLAACTAGDPAPEVVPAPDAAAAGADDGATAQPESPGADIDAAADGVEGDRPVAGPDAAGPAAGIDARVDPASASAAELYALRVGARWTYLRSGGLLRWKEITACEDVPLFDETGRVARTVRAYVRENRSGLGTTSVHYLIADQDGVHRIRRDDIDRGGLTTIATYAPHTPRILNGPYTPGRKWEFALRTSEFDPRPQMVPFRGATNTSAVDKITDLEPRIVVAGTFPTVGVDRQWAANNAHNVQSYYAPGVGEIVEVTVWPGTPLPAIQVEELVSYTPGYGSCGGAEVVNAQRCEAPLLVCDRPWGTGPRGCTDPRVDPANCGACGRNCPGGVCAGGTCLVGACPDACAGAAICCPSAWDWGAPGCTNPSRDPWNCGGCGRACPPGRICDRGVCSCAPGTRDCGSGCQHVLADPNNCGGCGNRCPADKPRCSMGVCYGGCAGLDLVECDGKCIDPDWDDNHCGRCGRKCGTGTGTLHCRAGECISCAKAGYVDCDGTCYDVAWSNRHCGACNNECPPGKVCAFGKCIAGDGSCICKDPDKICCKNNCINPRTSDTNCGGCGVAVCRGGCVEACRQGICSRVDCGGGDD